MNCASPMRGRDHQKHEVFPKRSKPQKVLDLLTKCVSAACLHSTSQSGGPNTSAAKGIDGDLPATPMSAPSVSRTMASSSNGMHLLLAGPRGHTPFVQRAFAGAMQNLTFHKGSAMLRIIITSFWAAALIPTTLQAAEDYKFPLLDVNKICEAGTQNDPGRITIINACIDWNQSGYNHLKYVWPLVSDDTYYKCSQMSERVNQRLGYKFWSDCVDQYIMMERMERDRTQQRKFQP